jgi:AcrR family transcriptional regulator
MIQKKDDAPKRMGRPRVYDPETALRRATDSFWKTGYAGTSLDDISAATGMNRPSLYAAFGDKRRLYLKALEAYWQLSHQAMHEALADESLGLAAALMQAYDAQLAIYFSGAGLARGCFVVGTAVTEALEDEDIRASLASGFRELDAALEVRFRYALAKGELEKHADPASLALLAAALLHSIAIRARTGTPRAELREIAWKAVNMICGNQGHGG